MAPSSPSAIGKKKRRRGKKEEASTSAAASGVHELKQKKRRAQRDGSQVPGAYSSYFSFKLELVILCRLGLLFYLYTTLSQP
jgi:hypothetical protein